VYSLELILASASPRRAGLLKQLGFPFKVLASSIDERELSQKEEVEQLALAKAKSVAEKVPAGIVLGADTIVLCNGQILGKPQDEAEAKKMLAFLSGKSHQVVTGVAVVRAEDGFFLTSREETEVIFRELDEKEINYYISTGEPLDKAGAYGIQGKGALLVQAIHGCYYNVVGLPLVRVFQLLQQAGYSPWLEAARKEAVIEG